MFRGHWVGGWGGLRVMRRLIWELEGVMVVRGEAERVVCGGVGDV